MTLTLVLTLAPTLTLVPPLTPTRTLTLTLAPTPPQVTGGLQDKVKKSTKELNPSVKSAKPTMHESMLWTNVPMNQI